MKYRKPQDLDRQTLLKHLTEGICQVTFNKVKDNTSRTIYCTLEPGFLPAKYEESIGKIFSDTTTDQDIFPIWDMAEGKWKSFRLSRITLFVTADELVTENNKAHSAKSDTVEYQEKVKNELAEKFKQRVEDLKKQAQEIKNKINGVNNEDEA